MAEDRRRRMERLLKVQEQLHRIEEWRLVEAQQQLDRVVRDQEELIRSLNAENGLEGLQGLFLDTAARRLKSLAAEELASGEAKDAQAERVMAEGARRGVAERLFAAATRAARRVEEENQLQETTERVAAQAPRKII